MSDDEEEMCVYIDFEEIESLSLDNANVIKLIGVESENPILQIGNRYYKGEHGFAAGTYVLFEKDDAERSTIKPASKKCPKSPLKIVTKTDKVLKMKRIFIQEKNFHPSDTEPIDALPKTIDEAMTELCTAIEESKSEKSDTLHN